MISGIRGVGKYGDRFLTVAGEGGGGLEAAFKQLATDCQALKEAAETGAATMSKEQADVLVRRANQAFGELKAASSKVLAEAKAAANMTVTGKEMEAVMQLTEIHTKILRAQDFTIRHITKMGRAVQHGRRLSELDEGQPIPGDQAATVPDNQSHPEQNQSVDPSLVPPAK
jgi:hypothetical protein